MADWYVSSASYSGYTAFAGSHTYSIGDLIKPTSPANKAKWVFRCTTGGLSTTEPTWATANNATSTSGTAVFTNVTGQSTFFWTAAAGDLATLCTTANRLAVGDRVFLASDHTETQTAGTNYGVGTNGVSGFGQMQFLSVNRAGSTPPVAADLTSGASVTVSSSTLIFVSDTECYHNGITYTNSGTGSIQITAISTTDGCQYFKNCSLVLSGASNGQVLFSLGYSARAILENTTVTFSASGQTIGATNNFFSFDFTWINTTSAVLGTAPSSLFNTSDQTILATCRGVDLSAVTSHLVANPGNIFGKYLFDSCKIASGVTRYSAGAPEQSSDEIELVNCYNGSAILSERYQTSGAVTTETTITLSGGATDNVGTFSHKMVTNANINKYGNTLNSFWMDVNNTLTGSSHTATVEIISSASLNNDEISLWIEYDGTASSSLASFANNFIATPLSTPAAVTSSSATWNSSPATPVTQHLQVTFTPQTAGRVRGQVRLGKASTTVYINPQVTIT